MSKLALSRTFQFNRIPGALWIGLIIAFFSFLLLRPYHLQATSLVYGGDDDDYLAHATAIAYGQFPDYTKEANYTFPPARPIGAGILAAPVVFGFSLLDRVIGDPVVVERTRPRLVSSWTAFGFVFATTIYLFASVFLLLSLCRRYGDDVSACWAVGLTIVGTGILLYVYRRPVLSHVYELFTVSGALYFLSSLQMKKPVAVRYWVPITLITTAGIVLVRYNNLILAFLVAVAAVNLREEAKRKTALAFLSRSGLRRVAFFGFWLFVVAAGTHLITHHVLRQSEAPRFVDLYGIVGDRLALKGLRFYAERLLHLFVGIDWGLIVSAPILLVGLWFCKDFRRFAPTFYLPLAGLAVNVFIILSWGTQSSWYGYRYLIFAATPFAAVGLAHALSLRKRSSLTYAGLTLLTIPSVLMMLAFEGNATNLTLTPGATRWGEGYVNNTYAAEVFKTALFDPTAFAVAVFKGGPLYLIYLISLLFGRVASLPAIVIEKYPSFDINVLVKSVLLWFSPIGFALLMLLPKRLRREGNPVR